MTLADKNDDTTSEKPDASRHGYHDSIANVIKEENKGKENTQGWPNLKDVTEMNICYVGCIGDDEEGKRIEKDFERREIKTCFKVAHAVRTGMSKMSKTDLNEK